MRIINIVDSVTDLNLGVWFSSIINAELLEKYGVSVEIWHPDDSIHGFGKAVSVQLRDTSIGTLKSLIRERGVEPRNDIIVSHGMWNYPSRWGYTLRKNGFKWICVPQGMLEPWPLQQKWLKKKLYFQFIEKPMLLKATIIRAVSQPEAKNLRAMFPQVKIEFIANGVKIIDDDLQLSNPQPNVKNYLFLSRLHHKKNVVALAEAWVKSKLNNNPEFELTVAGPDQGELSKLQSTIARSSNIKYVGAVFGDRKKELFTTSVFYILPSFSEGLPSALLEAMGHGLIPIITEGCNFPDVFENNLGVRVTPEINSIIDALEQTASWDSKKIKNKSERVRALIMKEYSLEAITKKQIEIYFGPEHSS